MHSGHRERRLPSGLYLRLYSWDNSLNRNMRSAADSREGEGAGLTPYPWKRLFEIPMQHQSLVIVIVILRSCTSTFAFIYPMRATRGNILGLVYISSPKPIVDNVFYSPDPLISSSRVRRHTNTLIKVYSRRRKILDVVDWKLFLRQRPSQPGKSLIWWHCQWVSKNGAGVKAWYQQTLRCNRQEILRTRS